MENNSTASGEIRSPGALAEQSGEAAQGLEKIAVAVDLLRLEMQGIRIVLEALVAKG